MLPRLTILVSKTNIVMATFRAAESAFSIAGNRIAVEDHV